MTMRIAAMLLTLAPSVAFAAGACPADVATARKFFEHLSHKDVDAAAELWATDARIWIPYPPRGGVSDIVGKQEIFSGFRTLFQNYARFDAQVNAVYPAADSDAVIVEYTVDALLESGTTYENTNIAVFRFRDGKIAAYHDYFDPRRYQAVVDAQPKP
ncbi:MAG: nuclear transport factor 2 family protein [Polyangiales bacterium]